MTSDICKIWKKGQYDIIFSFNIPSETFKGFVYICLALEIRNVVNCIKNGFLLKTGCATMRNYAETF